MLTEINVVTLFLQRRGVLLPDCIYAVYELIRTAKAEKGNRSSTMKGSKIGANHVSSDPSIVANIYFESVVVNIQRNGAVAMSDLEKIRVAIYFFLLIRQQVL